jgi:hypothetical protein
MANHKRSGPKSTRAGCLLCKPHKRQGVRAPRRQEARADEAEHAQRGDAADWHVERDLDCNAPVLGLEYDWED